MFSNINCNDIAMINYTYTPYHKEITSYCNSIAIVLRGNN